MTKQYFLILLLFAFGCKTKQNLDFIKTYEGQLNNSPILMKITSNAGSITGDCTYKSLNLKTTVKGNTNSVELTLNEFDENGNQTGIFRGEFDNPSKITGNWSKPNGDKNQSFTLIESTSNVDNTKAITSPTNLFAAVGSLRLREQPNQRSKVLYSFEEGEEMMPTGEKTDFKEKVELRGQEITDYWIKVKVKDLVGWVHGATVTKTKNTVLVGSNSNSSLNHIEVNGKKSKILWRGNERNVFLNSDYLNSVSAPIRAILAYYCALSSSDCTWADSKASNNEDMICRLTDELKLGLQCQRGHLALLKQWFHDERILSKINDDCFLSTNASSSYSLFDTLSIEEDGDKVKVNYVILFGSMRANTSAEKRGTDIFQIDGNTLKVLDMQENTKWE